MRSLQISYSQPLPPGCLTTVGEFYVNYTVATPWTTPSFVRVTRRVIIEDIDECTLDRRRYAGSCPSLIPQCDLAAGAQCINTIGSYSCQCPPNTSGDGFMTNATFSTNNDVAAAPPPSGYKGGTSCVDTSKPIITVRGPNPKIFKTCLCGGLSGVMEDTNANTNFHAPESSSDQRNHYEDNIKV